MVAYTNPDCLPYFEGTDSPCLNTGTVCDPSTVPCDFANLIEAKLDQFDETVDELAVSPPMAWIERTTTLRITIQFTIPAIAPVFDTVRVDTADMVNLDVDPNGITVTRSGLYSVFAYTTGTFDNTGITPGTFNMRLLFSPALQPYGPQTPTSLIGSAEVPLDNLLFSASIELVTPLTAGQVISMSMTASGAVNDFFDVTKASFGLFWVGDLP